MSRQKIKVMSVFGTRPEAVKMAPLVMELDGRPEFESICCLTGQHRQMLDSVMEIFHLHAQYDLNIMEQKQTLSAITTKTLLGMERILAEAEPDLILVHGDTSTTFAGALAAFYHKIPVGHVEAGLRTYDRYSPYPEEMNRTLVSDMAALHFAPTQSNAENLKRESVQGEIFVTGNTVIDAMKTTVRDDFVFEERELNRLDFTKSRVITLTCHRRENYGAPMEQIMAAVRTLVEENPQVEVVYPVHLSPVVQDCARRFLDGLPPGAPDCASGRGADAQSTCPVLFGPDGLRRVAGGSARSGKTRPGSSPGDGTSRGHCSGDGPIGWCGNGADCGNDS